MRHVCCGEKRWRTGTNGEGGRVNFKDAASWGGRLHLHDNIKESSAAKRRKKEHGCGDVHMMHGARACTHTHTVVKKIGSRSDSVLIPRDYGGIR